MDTKRKTATESDSFDEQFQSAYFIFGNGKISCTTAQTFEYEIKRWSKLTNDEKKACGQFVKDMNRKYGKDKHSFKLPE